MLHHDLERQQTGFLDLAQPVVHVVVGRPRAARLVVRLNQRVGVRSSDTRSAGDDGVARQGGQR